MPPARRRTRRRNNNGVIKRLVVDLMYTIREDNLGARGHGRQGTLCDFMVGML